MDCDVNCSLRRASSVWSFSRYRKPLCRIYQCCTTIPFHVVYSDPLLYPLPISYSSSLLYLHSPLLSTPFLFILFPSPTINVKSNNTSSKQPSPSHTSKLPPPSSQHIVHLHLHIHFLPLHSSISTSSTTTTKTFKYGANRRR